MTTGGGPYAAHVRARLEKLSAGLSSDLASVASLAPTTALDVVQYLLGVSCQAQNVGNIITGRRVFVRLPREWLLPVLPRATACLDLNDLRRS